MKQTAVEWLIEQLKINNYISDNAHWLVDEAKQMEKQHKIDAFASGYINGVAQNKITAEEYYNKTFKQ